MRSPEQIIGADALLQLNFEGYEVVPVQRQLLALEPDGFDEFWAVYPRKTAKPAAQKAYRAAIKRKAKHADIMAGAQRFAQSRPDPKFTPHPSTWLNQDRFNDTFAPATSATPTTTDRRNDLRNRIAERQGREGVVDPRTIRQLAHSPNR
jgi:hypothetical protein